MQAIAGNILEMAALCLMSYLIKSADPATCIEFFDINLYPETIVPPCWVGREESP